MNSISARAIPDADAAEVNCILSLNEGIKISPNLFYINIIFYGAEPLDGTNLIS
jgi:hypothetical protein